MITINKVAEYGVSCHAWNADRSRVALCPNTNEVQIYKREGDVLTLQSTLGEHDSIVTGIDWAPKTNRIVTSSQDRNAYVWTEEEGEGKGWKAWLVVLRINRAATSVKWSPKENKFAVGTGAKAIALCYFDIDNNWWVSKHIKGPKTGIDSTITCINWHPNNVLLAAGGTDCIARVFSGFIRGIDSKASVAGGTPFGAKLPTGKLLASFPTNSWVHDISFSPSGNQLAWVTHDCSVHILECSTSQHKEQLIKTRHLPFQSVAWANENTLIAGGHDANIIAFQGNPLQFKELGPLDKKVGGIAGTSNAKDLWEKRSRLGTSNDDAVNTTLNTRHQNAITEIMIVDDQNCSSVANDGNIIIWAYSACGLRI